MAIHGRQSVWLHDWLHLSELVCYRVICTGTRDADETQKAYQRFQTSALGADFLWAQLITLPQSTIQIPTPCTSGRISSDATSINLEGLQSPIIIKMGGDALDFRLVSCITPYNVCDMST
jgi:hypothetical protein